MDSSDSEDERYAINAGYQPILADAMANSPRSRQSTVAAAWPQDGVNMYQNDLYTNEGHVLGQGGSGPPAQQRPGSAQRMAQAKTGMAARRAERMQASAIGKNDSLSRNAGAAPASPSRLAASSVAYEPMPSYGAAGTGPASGAAPGSPKQDNIYGMRSSYDPNEDSHKSRFAPHEQRNDSRRMQQQGGGGYVPPAPPLPVQPQLDLSDIGAFLKQPGPKVGPVQCYIVRDKGSAKMYPRYNLFLEDGKRFLLAARKRKKQTTSNYIISLDYEDLGRDSEKFFGKLRSNFVGTDFSIYDNGRKENDARVELGCITYGYNVLGTRGPRKVTAVIPAVDAAGEPLYQPRDENDTMINRLKSEQGLDDLMIMFNKPPRWNEELNAYCLNFNGRVTEASVKNFQLVTEDNQGYVILQFGKIGRNTFTMDYQWPMSALQAFGMCLSAFDNKLACE